MVQPHFPVLADATLAAFNTVGEWLAQDDLSATRPSPEVDAVILAGNAVIPTIDAACRIAAQRDVPLLISGGIGHSTPFYIPPLAIIRVTTPYRSPGGPKRAFLPTLRGRSGRSPRRVCGLRIAPPTAVKTRALAGTC